MRTFSGKKRELEKLQLFQISFFLELGGLLSGNRLLVGLVSADGFFGLGARNFWARSARGFFSSSPPQTPPKKKIKKTLPLFLGGEPQQKKTDKGQIKRKKIKNNKQKKKKKLPSRCAVGGGGGTTFFIRPEIGIVCIIRSSTERAIFNF